MERHKSSLTPPSFATTLRYYREQAGLTQEELAERAGLSAKAVGALERGDRLRPHPNTSRSLAAALELSEAQRADFLAAIPRRHDPSDALPGSPPAALHPDLPDHLTALIGREDETARLVGMLRQPAVRLVSLTGPGGVGKTRLALHAARQLRPTFVDGVVLIALASLAQPAQVGPAIAQTLGVREHRNQTLLERLTESLQTRRLLLVLDNFEHVASAAPLVAELLAACSGLKVMATSRAPLHLRGEHRFPVPPFALSTPASLRTVPDLASTPATRLFLERVQEMRPDFVPTDADVEPIAAICARLDGLPLAIELAATRAELLSPHALLSRLEQRLSFLTHGPRDLPSRQRTLRETIAWSYELLSPVDQALFRRLAVFRGGCALESIAAVSRIDASSDGELLDGITVLVDHSLVRLTDEIGEIRVSMLETIREYGLERLNAHRELEGVRSGHAAHYLTLAQQAAPELIGPRPEVWLVRLEAEHDNLTAALDWFADLGDIVSEARLAGLLREYWYATGRWTEGRVWLERSTARVTDLPDDAAATVLVAAGFLSHYQGDDTRAVPLLEQGRELLERTGNNREEAYARYLLGVVAEDRGDYLVATELLREAVRRLQALGDATNAAYGEAHLGIVTLGMGDPARAAVHGEAARALALGGGSHDAEAVATLLLGDAARDGGDLQTAAMRYGQYLAITGDAYAATESIARAAVSVGVLAVAHGQSEQAVRLLGVAERLRESVGLFLAQPERTACEQAIAHALAALGPATFDATLRAGRALDTSDAVAGIESIIAVIQSSAS